MSVKAGMTYTAEVIHAALTASQTKGTPAISLSLETEDGVINHDLWITPKTKDRVAETMFATFGVTEKQLQGSAFIANISAELTGKRCSITTKEEDYNGTPQVKVQWLNPEKKQPSGDLTSQVAAIFGGADSSEISDESVPF